MRIVKAAACGLALTLLFEHDVCPSCGWAASDHRQWPHREHEPAVVEPVENAPPSSEVPPPAPPDAEAAPFVVENPRGLEGLSGARVAKALRIVGRACLEAADALDGSSELAPRSDS